MATARAGQMEQVGIRRDAMAAPRNKPFAWNRLLIHVLLIACVAVVAFPLYFAFVISTQDLQQVVQRPPRLIPSVHAVDNYVEAWRKAHMGRMLFNLIATLDLQRISLGGSVFWHNRDFLLPRLQAEIDGKLEALTRGAELVPAGLGEKVGDYGALALLD